MKKIFYFDCETTGLDPRKAAIIQAAYIIEIGGEVKEEGNILIQPHQGADIEDGALRINKRTREEIMRPPFMPPREAYFKILSTLDKYIDRFNRQDKFYPAGYNVGFDIEFMSQFFLYHGNIYFGSYFNGRPLDSRTLMAFLDYKSEVINLDNHKLITVCNALKIPIEAHDALSDIRATRLLMKKLLQRGDTLIPRKKGD